MSSCDFVLLFVLVLWVLRFCCDFCFSVVGFVFLFSLLCQSCGSACDCVFKFCVGVVGFVSRSVLFHRSELNAIYDIYA